MTHSITLNDPILTLKQFISCKFENVDIVYVLAMAVPLIE